MEDSGIFKIIVAKTNPLGRVLIFKEGDDITIQTAEKFDFYDEIITHIPMSAHRCPRRVLVIGGGDGVVVREVLKHNCVGEVHVVEIDPLVVELSKKYLRLDDGGLSDRRVKIFYDDAANYIRKCSETYDVIIGDYSDPYEDAPARTLIREEFYRNLYRILDEGGVISLQAGSPIFQKEIFLRIYSNIKKVFPVVRVVWTVVPYYPGAIWTFVVATKGVDPTKPVREPQNTEFYSRKIHEALFVLPKFLEELIGEENEIDGEE